LVPTPRKYSSLIDFQIFTKLKEISKIVLTIIKLGQQYKTLSFRCPKKTGPKILDPTTDLAHSLIDF
jgi:hypothetical protein